MLGPLPRLYRSIVVTAALVVFLAFGVWLAQILPLPVGGLLVGGVAGVLIAFVLVHDSRRRTRSVRIVRRHP